jgi:hypothetical protein
MVRFITTAAAHNVAGGETIRLIYHRVISKSKYPSKSLFCNAISQNEKGGPTGPPLIAAPKPAEGA